MAEKKEGNVRSAEERRRRGIEGGKVVSVVSMPDKPVDKGGR